VGEHLSCNVTLETPNDLALGLALGETSSRVNFRFFVVRDSHHRDAPQGVVSLSISRAIESVTNDHARRGLDG
jgi:hypothetical protein